MLARLKNWVFAPPYRGVPWLIWGYFFLSFLAFPGGVFSYYRSLDTDDYMRLLEVRSLLNGQGWFDLSVPRLAPGHNTMLYWSRLVDVPLALVTLLFKPFLGEGRALQAAALFVPFTLFAVLTVWLAPLMARPLVPGFRSRLAALFPLFAMGLSFQFSPSRVDHHAYQILLAGFSFVLLVRLLYTSRAAWPPVLLGLCGASGLWIGAEGLPTLMLTATSLVLFGAWRGGNTLKAVPRYGVSLALFTALALGLARRPEDWSLQEISWFSSAYAILAALIGAGCLIGWALARKTAYRSLRLGLFAALGFFLATLFFVFVPHAVQGPYADFADQSAQLVLGHVPESRPLILFLSHVNGLSAQDIKAVISFVCVFCYAAIALVAAPTLAWRGPRRLRPYLLLFALFEIPFLLAALFWQMRVLTYVHVFSVPFATWALWCWWDRAAVTLAGRRRFAAEILALLLLTLVPTVFIPNAFKPKNFHPQTTLFPAIGLQDNCSKRDVSAFLADPQKLGDRVRTILTIMNDGPELLFRTPHNVLAAPYNVETNRDSFAFFHARQEQEARALFNRSGADLVLVCRAFPPYYAGMDETGDTMADVVVRGDGTLGLESDKNHPTMIERLAKGDAPSWLKPVGGFSDPEYRLYERAASAQGGAP